MRTYPEYRDTGLPEIGTIPTHWDAGPIKRGYEVVLGKMLKRAPATTLDLEAPYLRAANIQPTGLDLDDLKTMWFSSTELHRLQIEQGDLLVSEGGDVGRAVIAGPVNGELGFQNSVNRVRAYEPNTARFLYYWLRAVKDAGYIDALCNKSTIAHFTAEKVQSALTPYPTGDEQIEIVRYLDRETSRIDTLITKQQRLVELLQERRQALITRAVTKGLDPAVSMKDSGVEWLGEVPAHWHVHPLKRISALTVGIVVEPAKHYVESGVPTLRSLNIRPGFIDQSNLVYISDDSNRLLSKSRLRSGDLVAVRTGQPGTTAVIPAELDGCNCIDLIIIRKPVEGCQKYLCWYLAADVAVRQFSEGSGGAIQQHFNVGTAMNLLVVVPPTDEQVEIADFLDSETTKIDHLIDQTQRMVALSREHRAALISAAVTGKIDVRQAA
ncbi:restriction endonuclease subunit S [Lysobacter sp. CFH 32150]|uniref:restriction endonuclease subunit S n=1 Tax=Lysobacter sp. CFH 32150 TaxID=2927128 RepID=UPI001FA7AFD7|nr:restriction endonuclease subunit S [Lysobacter sp. CFH 32150]MCI4568953.1 restriction endonuclease subunit S [Lysobacter sp. CFH 32150]